MRVAIPSLDALAKRGILLSMILVAIQGLLGVASIYLAFHVAVYPVDGRRKRMKSRFVFGFCALCVGMFVCGVLQ